MIVNDGSTRPFTYGCLQPEYSLLIKGMVGKTAINNKHFSYMIDWDGTYNSKNYDNNHKGKNGWNEFKSNLNNLNSVTHNMGPKTTFDVCKTRCDSFEQCLGFTFGENDEQVAGDYCQMLLQCKKKSTPTNTQSSYLKTSWASFEPESITPFSVCEGISLNYPSVLGLDVPPTVPQCAAHCATLNGAQYFQIDKNLHCECFSACTITQDNDSTDQKTEDATWRTTVYKMKTNTQPTKDPTKAPTNDPTKAPTTKSPTVTPGSPSNAPTNDPTKVPTAVPTAVPTGTPTSSSPPRLGGVIIYMLMVEFLILWDHIY